MGQIDSPDYLPELRISVSTFYDDIWIKIEHNGSLMTDHEQQYLFDSFDPINQSAKNTPSKQMEGAQRLSFSYFIITEQHQGQLAVLSDSKANTTFSLRLPKY